MKFQKASTCVFFLSVALFQALFCHEMRPSFRVPIDPVTLTLRGAILRSPSLPFIHNGIRLNTVGIISLKIGEFANALVGVLPVGTMKSGDAEVRGLVGESIDVGLGKDCSAMVALAAARSDAGVSHKVISFSL